MVKMSRRLQHFLHCIQQIADNAMRANIALESLRIALKRGSVGLTARYKMETIEELKLALDSLRKYIESLEKIIENQQQTIDTLIDNYYKLL